MMKKIGTLLALCAFVVAVTATGCGVQSISPPSSTITKVNGVAATGTPIMGTVTLVDSSSPAKQAVTSTASNGSFLIQATGMNPPYVLRADWTDGAGAQQLFALADGSGTANINPLSNAIFAASTGQQDQSSLTSNMSVAAMQSAKKKHPEEKSKLRKKLAQLFEKYGVVLPPDDEDDDEYEADHTGLDALFDDIRIKVEHGTVYVTNKKTKKLIFVGPVGDLESGTFYPENMPGGSGTTPPDGAALYGQNCSSCHGALATSSKPGATASRIQAAITNNTGGMGSLSGLTALEIQAIATALAQTPNPNPAPMDGATLYAQSCSSCHGPLATSTKLNATALQIQGAITNNTGGMGTLSGLTGSEIQRIATALVKSTPTPATPDGAALYTAKCASCHGPLATTSKAGRTAAQIQAAITNNTGGMGGLSGLTSAEIQAIAAALPAAQTPTACTYTYSGWGACLSNGTQTRTMTSSSPAGCTGTPVLSQTCTYVPPTPTSCTYTYSAWGACRADGTQTRTMGTAAPAGCTGAPVLSQSCTYVPPAIDGAALYTSDCASCHGPLATTSKAGRTAAQIQTAITNNTGGMGSLSALTTTEIQAIAAALPPATTPACGSCHAIPPATGQHAFHSTRATCATCHGTGYSTTTVNTATHANGTVNIASTPGWDPSTRSCSNACHSTKSW